MIFEATPTPQDLPMDLDDDIPTEISGFEWDTAMDIPGVSLADLPMFKGIGEGFDFS
jgi:hypothetical protein